MNVVVEPLAVVLALAYLLLAARESLWCWYCAFVSSALYMFIFWDARLLMEVALNGFYIVMAVLGWWRWRRGGAQRTSPPIVSLVWWQHVALLGAMLLLAALNGWVMQRYTDAAWPFVDSFITWGAVLNTVLVIRKVLENWLYWILLDGLAIVVYLDRELYLTALLFALYVVIVVFGYIRWLRQYHQASQLGNAPQA